MTGNSGRPLVLGIGNAFRRDDGIGLWIAQELAKEGHPVRLLSGEGAEVLEAIRDQDWVLLTDAAKSGARAGKLHVLDAAKAPLPSGFFHYSTHLFGVAEAVEMARELGCLPKRLDIFAIEGREFGFGEGFSPAVAKAGARALARIRGHLEN